MELNNKTTIIIVVAVICLTFILATALYLNSGGEINPLSQDEPMHIINTTFSTQHSLDAKTICTINVGSDHSDEKVIVEVLYSRDGANLNDGDKVEKTVGSDGSIVCESKDSYDKYPDHAIVTLYDHDGNVLARGIGTENYAGFVQDEGRWQLSGRDAGRKAAWQRTHHLEGRRYV